MDVAGIEEGMDVIYGLIIPTPSWDHMIMIMGSLRIALKILSLSLSVNLPFWFLFDQLTHDQGYMTGWKSPTARPM